MLDVMDRDAAKDAAVSGLLFFQSKMAPRVDTSLAVIRFVRACSEALPENTLNRKEFEHARIYQGRLMCWWALLAIPGLAHAHPGHAEHEWVGQRPGHPLSAGIHCWPCWRVGSGVRSWAGKARLV